MDDFARSPVAERREIMQERATQMNLDFTIVEKDFWVCWTLASVFALGPDHPRMTFKGGTSLSKAYALIERFSEDVDLVTESAYFIARGAADPDDAGLSKTKREDRMRRLDEACAEYIGGRLLPELRAAFAIRLGSVDDWNITVDPNDRNSLLFQLPRRVGPLRSRRARFTRRRAGFRETSRTRERLSRNASDVLARAPSV